MTTPTAISPAPTLRTGPAASAPKRRKTVIPKAGAAELASRFARPHAVAGDTLRQLDGPLFGWKLVTESHEAFDALRQLPPTLDIYRNRAEPLREGAYFGLAPRVFERL